jgi:radical SAM superfamily enzyme YgiQ (UPF0313 family)
MVDVLLIQPPIRDFYFTTKRSVPYGLASIAAALDEKGVSVDLIDALATAKSRPLPLPPEMAYLKAHYGRPDIAPFALFHRFRHFGYSYQHLRGRIKASGAALVGISSLFTPYAAEALETAALVRDALPRCRIVLGGHHPTALPASVMASNHVDFVIRGEGEAALPALFSALAGNGALEAVPGIVFRQKNGSLHISEPAVLSNLDQTPPPLRRLMDGRHYRRNRRGATVVVTSRGCPLSCAYCALGNKALYPYRRRSVASVLEEISDAVRLHDARFIDFEDETLSHDRAWFLSLLTGIRERFGAEALELRAMNGLFPPTLNEKVVAAMKAAGFRSLNLSLGSACPGQLKRFGRPDIRLAFDHALSLAETHGMDAVGYIIVGAPFQEPEESVTDLCYLASRRVLAGVSVYYPAPGSRDYDICRSLGILPEAASLLRTSALPLSHTTSRLESATLLRLGRILNFMKQLLDAGHAIPERQPFMPPCPEDPMDPKNRLACGNRFLAAFLHDGIIRGITPEGEVYAHAAARPLIEKFLQGLQAHPVVPVRLPSR